MSPDSSGDLAAFEALWLLRLRELAAEAVVAFTLAKALCGDTSTARAIARGDEAARAETLRVFERLSALHSRYADEFMPAPPRLQAVAVAVGQAFAALGPVAATLKAASEPPAGPEGFEMVAEQLAEAAQLLVSVAQREPPAPTRSPAARRKPRSRGGVVLND